jgi:hypothetical protein
MRMTELVECEYCGQFLDPVEDEAELFPVFVGEPPDVPEVEVRGTAEKKEKVAAYEGGKERVYGEDSTVMVDMRLDHVQALMDAIQGSPHFDLDTYDRVMDVGSHDFPARVEKGDGFVDANDKIDRLESEVNEDEVAVTVKAQLHTQHTADLMVCEYCRDTLKGDV